MKKHTILKTSETKEFRKILSKNILTIFVLCIIQMVVAFGCEFLGIANFNEFYGILYITYCIIAVGIVWHINKDYVLDIHEPKEKMTPMTFVKHFCCMITMMLVFTIPTVVIDMILMQFGLTTIAVSSANELSSSVTEIFYVCLIGPICEEVLFRGLIQKSLQKFSPVIAIITSAVCFGVYHGNFGQMFSMIGVGLILGYVAYKYSLKWSMIIHIIYNTVFGELFGLLSQWLDKDGEEYLLPIINQTPFLTTVLTLSFIGIVFFAIQMFKKGMPFADYKIKAKKILQIFLSGGMIVFLTYNLITACLLIEKIS